MTRPAASPTAAPSLVHRLRQAGCVFAEDEADILLRSAADANELEVMLRRRIDGQPLEHVVGWAELAGVRVAVDPGVFVPRRRSELLVDLTARAARPGSVVLDLCCGTGAIGVAVCARVRDIVLHASDIDPAAVCCARRNVEPLGGAVTHGDLFDPLPVELLGRVDVLVCHAPYVPDEALPVLPREAREHEPRAALSGGVDGLDLQRRVVSGARRWLRPDGCLLVETSHHQAPATEALFLAAGFAARVEHDDEIDATVVVGSVGVRG